MSQPQQLTIEQAILRAKEAVKQGNTAVALQLYNAVLQHQPNHPVAKKGLRELQKELPQNQSAQAQAANPSQDQLDVLLNPYHSGEMVKAEQACRELLQSYPQSSVVINILGAALQWQGKLQEAVQAYNKAIQLKPDYADAYSNRGNALRDLGQLGEAVESYDEAIRLNPDYALAYNNRGNVLGDLGQLEEAVESYDEAIRLKPDYAMAYSGRGDVLGDLGQLEEAVACFNKVLEIDPDDVHHGVRLKLARLGVGKIPDRTPELYMQNFYRLKSRDWDQPKIQYQGHHLVREAIECVVEKKERFDILDLGCGTGSLADFLRSYARRLDGVDLSPDMLKRSAERGVYDNLAEENLVKYLDETSHSYSLVVAAAVLIHFADLETIFSLVWGRLNENGRFIFSLFSTAEEEVELNSLNMYAHSDHYIRQLVDRTGFRLCYQKEGIHEYEYNGKDPVIGAVYLLEKQSQPRRAILRRCSPER